MDKPDWLPEKLYYYNYHKDWQKFIQVANEIFVNDFCKEDLYLNEMKVDFDHSICDGKIECFRHIVEGSGKRGLVEHQETILRAERIGWIKPIILNNQSNSILKWENKRGRKTKILLWLKDIDELGFIVILFKKSDSEVFLETAYPINWGKYRKQIEKEYCAYKSSKRRPE